jgi:dCMP deaminase
MTQTRHDYIMRKTSDSKALIYDKYYLAVAQLTSQMSHDTKIQVGSIIVRNGQILSQGWNGTPSGTSNKTRDSQGVTKLDTIHSEENALMKLARNGGGSDGATIYCTHSPCYGCAKLILQAGIKRVVYSELYCSESRTFMKERGLELVFIRPSDRVSQQEDLTCKP